VVVSVPILAAVAVAGAAGAVLRHALVAGLQGLWPGQPWPIAVVNVVGCFGFGCCWAIGVAAGRWSPAVAAAVLAGFFGAFTTFSSFAFDSHAAWLAQRPLLALGNLLLQNVLGLVAMAGGIALGQAFSAD
jgi:fluoride exporter